MKLLKTVLGNSSGRRMLDNYAALLFIHGANILLPLLILPYLVRVLGTEKYGLILLAQSFCTILYVFVEFGFGLSATRKISLLRDDKAAMSEVFSAVLGIKFLFASIVFVVYLALVFSFDRFSSEAAVFLLSFGVVFGQAVFPDWFFQGIEKMRFIAVINVIAKFIFTILIFVFIKETADYTSVPLFNSIGFIVAGVLSLLISFRFTTLKLPKRSVMKSLVLESSSLFVSNFAARLFNSANVFILGIFGGDALAGIYGSMEKIILAFKSFFTPLFQAIFPWLSNQDNNKQRAQIRKLAPIVTIVSIIFIAGTYIFGDWVLEVLFNKPEINAYAPAFKWMSLLIIFASLNMLLVSLYFPASGQYKVRMKVLLFAGVFNVVLATILVYKFQLYGLVVTIISTEFLLLLLAFYYYRKGTNLTV